MHSLYMHLRYILKYDYKALQHIILDIQYSTKVYFSNAHSSRQLYSQQLKCSNLITREKKQWDAQISIYITTSICH